MLCCVLVFFGSDFSFVEIIFFEKCSWVSGAGLGFGSESLLVPAPAAQSTDDNLGFRLAAHRSCRESRSKISGIL